MLVGLILTKLIVYLGYYNFYKEAPYTECSDENVPIIIWVLS